MKWVDDKMIREMVEKGENVERNLYIHNSDAWFGCVKTQFG